MHGLMGRPSNNRKKDWIHRLFKLFIKRNRQPTGRSKKGKPTFTLHSHFRRLVMDPVHEGDRAYENSTIECVFNQVLADAPSHVKGKGKFSIAVTPNSMHPQKLLNQKWVVLPLLSGCKSALQTPRSRSIKQTTVLIANSIMKRFNHSNSS